MTFGMESRERPSGEFGVIHRREGGGERRADYNIKITPNDFIRTEIEIKQTYVVVRLYGSQRAQMHERGWTIFGRFRRVFFFDPTRSVSQLSRKGRKGTLFGVPPVTLNERPKLTTNAYVRPLSVNVQIKACRLRNFLARNYESSKSRTINRPLCAHRDLDLFPRRYFVVAILTICEWKPRERELTEGGLKILPSCVSQPWRLLFIYFVSKWNKSFWTLATF